MIYRRLLACGVLAALPAVASAQTGVYFTPAKIVKTGTNTTPAPAAGAVSVKVFVRKNGSFTVSGVASSTNPADNAAALEVAKNSSYKPAIKDGKTVDSFYTFRVKFAGDGASNTGDAGDASDAGGSGPTAAAFASIGSGKYDLAKTQLAPYLAAHPDDRTANLLLGVASGFAGDAMTAAPAFDKAGTLPSKYRVLAIQMYVKAGSESVRAGKNDDGVAFASKAIALDPTSIDGYNVRGTAQANAGKFEPAIADFEKSKSLAIAAKIDPKIVATIELNLMTAQLSAGQFDAGTASGKDVVHLDPALQAKVTSLTEHLYLNSAITMANAGNRTDAIARLESGATAYPGSAGEMYAEAAFLMAAGTPVDWKKVKTEADRSLAVEPENGRANFVAGVALANDKASNDAVLPYLNKAKASPLYTSDASFAKQVDAALKMLVSAPKSPAK